MHLKILTSLLVISSGCTPWFSTPRSVYKKLPSVWEKDYGIIEYSKGEWVTKFWAQEAVGVPEARSYIRKLVRTGFFFSESDITIIKDDSKPEDKAVPDFRKFMQKYGCVKKNNDNTFSEGGYENNARFRLYASRLIAGKSEIAVSSRARIAEIINVGSEHKWSDTEDTIFSGVTSIIITDSLLKSIGLPRMYSRATIYVASTGDVFPQPMLDLRVGMVTAGSIDPSGWISKFSQSNGHVAVLAPSVRAFSNDGAVFLVNGALAEVKSILPALTKEDALHLLQKTAIKTTINEVSSLSKVGSLNQYKMLRVAKRLADAGFPANKYMLSLSATYDFTAEAEELAEEANKLIASGDNDKANYQSGFKKLRIAFFLNPDNSVIRDKLAKIYRHGGHNIQAMFYAEPKKLMRHEDVVQKIVHRAKRIADFQLFEFIQKIGNWEKVIEPEETMLSSRGLDIILTLVRNDVEAKVRDNPADMELAPKSPADYIAILGKNTEDNWEQLKLLALMINYVKDTQPHLLNDRRVSDVITKHQQAINVITIASMEKVPVYDNNSLSEKRVAGLLRNLKCYPSLWENKIREKFVTDRDELIEDAASLPIHDISEKIIKAI